MAFCPLNQENFCFLRNLLSKPVVHKLKLCSVFLKCFWFFCNFQQGAKVCSKPVLRFLNSHSDAHMIDQPHAWKDSLIFDRCHFRIFRMACVEFVYNRLSVLSI